MTQPNTPRIYSYITKSTFLNIEDALQIGKIKFFGGLYKNGNGATHTLTHYVDTAVIRPHLHDMLWSKAIETKDYKGSTKDGRTTSRILSINTKEKGYFIELASGPGKKTNTGAVLPAGKAETAVNIFVPFDAARMIAADILEYLQARRTTDLLANYPPELLAPADQVDEQPAAIEEEPDPAAFDDFDNAFPRKPDPAADAKLHKYKYKDGKTAPKNERTRAIYDSYFLINRRSPASGKALRKWWEENKPPDDAPAEA